MWRIQLNESQSPPASDWMYNSAVGFGQPETNAAPLKESSSKTSERSGEAVNSMRIKQILTAAVLALLMGNLSIGDAKQQSPTPDASAPKPSGTDSLPIPVEEIIRRFAQHESEFKVARENYTYTQEVSVED